MRTFLLAGAAAGLALTTAACQGTTSRAEITRLDCPATEGELTRVSAAADGKSCLYRSGSGEEVTLRLIPVSGDPAAALAPIEAELEAILQPAPSPAGEPAADATAPAAPPASDPDQAAAVVAQAEADAATTPAGRDDSHGWKIAEGDGDRATVRLPGIRIDAEGETAKVRVGPLHVDAGEEQTTVRIYRDVRLKGEALATEKRGVRAMYILIREGAGPYDYVGYEAGGPKAGPLAVAIMKGRGDHEEGRLHNDVEDLVRRNGGV